MSLIALDLLKEEYLELRFKSEIGLTTSQYDRVQLLKEAIQELESITLNSDCINCRYNNNQEELSELNDDEYLQAFNRCRTCSNYYPNNFGEK